jgi:predicted secreted protein
MHWTSALAIYVLFWFLAVFLVLPFGVRTTHEAGEQHIPGTAESAPHVFLIGRFFVRTTIVATVMFAAFYLNYVNGWITADMLDWTGVSRGI